MTTETVTYPNLTDEKILSTLKALASESPEFVYSSPEHQIGTVSMSSCFYVHTDPETKEPVSAGCIVGKVLHELGVPLEVLQKYESTSANKLLEEIAPETTSNARFRVDVAQTYQDDGQPWGLAYEMATEATI